jgi:hypothetical protein
MHHEHGGKIIKGLRPSCLFQMMPIMFAATSIHLMTCAIIMSSILSAALLLDLRN